MHRWGDAHACFHAPSSTRPLSLPINHLNPQRSALTTDNISHSLSEWNVTNSATMEAVSAHRRRAHLVGNNKLRSSILNIHTHPHGAGWLIDVAFITSPVLRILPDESKLAYILARRTILILLYCGIKRLVGFLSSVHCSSAKGLLVGTRNLQRRHFSFGFFLKKTNKCCFTLIMGGGGFNIPLWPQYFMNLTIIQDPHQCGKTSLGSVKTKELPGQKTFGSQRR